MNFCISDAAVKVICAGCLGDDHKTLDADLRNHFPQQLFINSVTLNHSSS